MASFPEQSQFSVINSLRPLAIFQISIFRRSGALALFDRLELI
jgi:hypothetical protein